MKKIAFLMLVAGLALTGCAQKETAEYKEKQARKFLVEGTVFLKQAEPVKAVQSFASAIQVAPDYFESYYMLTETFLHLQQYAQASAVMASAAQRFPDNGLVFYMLAMAEKGAGNLTPAVLAAKKSSELFRARQDEEGFRRATVLLAMLVSEAKQAAEAAEANQAGQKTEAATVEVPAVEGVVDPAM